MVPGGPQDWSAFASRLAASWAAHEPDVQHRQRTGCLVSADLSGFTALSERLAQEGKRGAEKLTDVVNGAFTALIDAAAGFGGDVLKFGGDALLLWFEGDGCCDRACRAAARMQDTLTDERSNPAGLSMSVGLDHGAVDLFLVGEPDWRELVLLGATVSGTVGLEAAAAAGQVLVGPAVAERVDPAWCEPASPQQWLLLADRLPDAATTGALPDGDPIPAGGVAELVPPAMRANLRALAALEGEHRLASTAFLELHGTDRILSDEGAETTADMLDQLVQAAQRTSLELGVQFLYTDVLADGLKLVFTAGAPTTTEHDEESLLRLALAMVQGDPWRRLAAGVNGGRVFAGFLGSPERNTYTVMGDDVNLAARLMGRADTGQVLATRSLVDRSQAEFVTRDLEPFHVKGKSQPVEAVEVLSATAARRRDTAEGPLVGREAELATLGDWMDAAVDGRGAAAEVVGPAGIGKSRLVAEVARDPRLANLLRVDCQPYDVSTPYAAARAVLRAALRIRPDAGSSAAGSALTAAATRSAPDVLPLLPLVAVVVGADVPGTPEADAVASQFRVRRTHEAVAELLGGVLTRPTLMQVEDAYYVDPASRALFDALAGATRGRPWLLLATSRPGTEPFFADGTDHHRLDLEPLGRQGALQLIHQTRGGKGLQGTELTALLERAGGNPLFALQLMAAVRDGVPVADLPESVERVVAERLDRLAPDDRTLLRHAAVLGPRFDTALLEPVLTQSSLPLPDDATWERLSDLVESDGSSVHRFLHVMYRDVAYEGLSYRRRTGLHLLVGELLEDGANPDASLLSEHFSLAGDSGRTWTYSVRAGDEAWAALAMREAAVAYRRALDVRAALPEVDVQLFARVAESLGDVLERSAEYDEADTRYEDAQEWSGAVGDAVTTAQLLRKRGVLRERAGKYQEALDWYERAQGVVADHPSAHASLLVASAGVMHRLGRFDALLDLAGQAVERASDAGDEATEAHACLLVQLGRTALGESDHTAFGERALALFTRIGNVLYEGKAHNNLGIALYYGGDWPGAAGRYRLAAERFVVAGDVVEAASARNNEAEILSDQGYWDRASELFHDALQTWQAAQYPLGSALALSNLGRARARGGEDAAAMVALTAAVAQFEQLQADGFLTDAQLRLAEAHLLSGRVDLADALLTVADARLEDRGGFPGTTATLARLRCWTGRLAGDLGGALDQARRGVAEAEAASARYERALLLHEVAVLSDDPVLAQESAAEQAALGVVALPALNPDRSPGG